MRMTSKAPALNNSVRRFWIIFGVATLLALFFATKDSFWESANGLEVRWVKNLWWKAMEWYAWALFSPLIFLVCRRFSRSRWRLIFGQLGAAIIFALLHCGIVTTGAWIEAQVIHTGLGVGRLWQIIVTSYFHEDVLTYAGIVSVWYALDYYRRFREREQRASELEGHLSRARLQALKMQLHPHFLFNTLNGIAALNYENPKAANRMLARLSELLRLALDDDDAPEAPLRKELEFNRRYLELEQIRLGDRLTTKLEIAPDTLDASVPNLLLQPLVENAIRHAIAPYAAPGQICIQAHRQNDMLCLRVSDSGPGLRGDPAALNGPGLGLKNTRARLRHLYGNAHRFELTNAAAGGLTVQIVIPFRAATTNDEQVEAGYEDSNAYY
jgi:signal transduction histidine kinase